MSDSEALVLPIDGPDLTEARSLRRADVLRRLYQEVHSAPTWASERALKERPSYTLDAFKVALRTGVDPAGRLLSSAMPRYSMPNEALESLYGYLQRLGAEPPPGVTQSTITLATVVAGNVDPWSERAMLDVMHAYLDRFNLDVGRELARPSFSPYYKSELRPALRKVNLEVYRLRGDATTWPAQLEQAYSIDPAFAIVGGVSQYTWDEIHLFCERKAIPCLFPNTDAPGRGASTAQQSIYLDEGGKTEARGLARYLADRGELKEVVQVFRDGPEERRLAEAFAEAVAATGARIPDTVLLPEAEPAPLQSLVKDPSTVLVLWLTAADRSWQSVQCTSISPKLYGSGSLLFGDAPPHSRGLPSCLAFAWRYALPGQEVPQLFRTRAWLEARKVRAPDRERIQLNTFFAMSAVEHALVHMVDHYSRDYLIESVEHEVENALNPGNYPRSHLGLGPGQRFASKGTYIAHFDTDGVLRPLSAWILAGSPQ